jgi:hypothetical protein
MIDLLTTPTGTQIKDFLAALTKGLQTNGALMKTFETQQTKRATWNGRKMVLQAALNDLFGIAAAPFILVESNQSIVTNTFFYEDSELSPVYFSESIENDPVFFFENTETTPIDYDFKILIPSGIDTVELERQVRAQTNLYKLVGPSFILTTY